MSEVHLADYIDNAEFQLERLVPRLRAAELSWAEIQTMTFAYRQRGVCTLLLTGIPDLFYISMMQSAGAFLYYLQRCPDERKVTSESKPFFDALCGAYVDGAEAIVLHSRSSWNPDQEYEEEFLYIYLLMQILLEPDSTSRCPALLERLEVVHTPSEASRLDLCRSLLTRDSIAFDTALAAVLEERGDRVAAMIERGALPEELAAWMRPFAGEGLAVIRLAEKLGMKTGPQYLHVPELLRPVSPYLFDPDAWRVLEYSPA